MYFHVEEMVRGSGLYVGAGDDTSFVQNLGHVKVVKGGRMEIDEFFTNMCKRLLEGESRWPRPIWTEDGKSGYYLEELRKYRGLKGE